MLSAISQQMKEKIRLFMLSDNLLLNNKVIPLREEKFQPFSPSPAEKTIAFIDGGQAEVFSGGNIHLSFIRVFSQIMKGTQKTSSALHEFYLFTTSSFADGEIWYESKVFPLTGAPLVEEFLLRISSTHPSIRSGTGHAPIGKIMGFARRLAELKLAGMMQTDYVLLDGTLEAAYPGEEQYILPSFSALAKTCSLFTTQGNNPVVLLQKISPHQGCWSYALEGKTYFVKLHPQSRHVFRFEGKEDLLPLLLPLCSDSLFPGYPYGLILADRMARVSNQERASLRLRLLLRSENRELVEYLQALNAHDILDSIG